MSFKQTPAGPVALWSGNPNCDAAHTYLRNWLRQHVGNFPTAWTNGDTRTQGNLGETIAFCVGAFAGHGNLHCFPANAFNPFSGISRSDIDLLWIGFANAPTDDFVIHQEVKTTFGADLSYADSLLKDYDKAFGKNPRFQLNTHLQSVKSQLRYGYKRPDLAARVNALQATTPKNANRIIAIPTLVHDLANGDPSAKMAGISAVLTANGWSKVTAWAIGLSQLEDRLSRITRDQP
ncbi:MAG: hypothetical protein AB7J34_07640 [Limisphaerales bacterium]